MIMLEVFMNTVRATVSRLPFQKVREIISMFPSEKGYETSANDNKMMITVNPKASKVKDIVETLKVQIGEGAEIDVISHINLLPLAEEMESCLAEERFGVAGIMVITGSLVKNLVVMNKTFIDSSQMNNKTIFIKGNAPTCDVIRKCTLIGYAVGAPIEKENGFVTSLSYKVMTIDGTHSIDNDLKIEVKEEKTRLVAGNLPKVTDWMKEEMLRSINYDLYQISRGVGANERKAKESSLGAAIKAKAEASEPATPAAAPEKPLKAPKAVKAAPAAEAPATEEVAALS